MKVVNKVGVSGQSGWVDDASKVTTWINQSTERAKFSFKWLNPPGSMVFKVVWSKITRAALIMMSSIAMQIMYLPFSLTNCSNLIETRMVAKSKGKLNNIRTNVAFIGTSLMDCAR